VVTVTIPAHSFDGDKGIVVTSVNADGTFAYLPNGAVLRGPSAQARLSDTKLTPNESFRVTGSRFLPGADVKVVVFPEAVLLATVTPDGDGSFSVGVRMPSRLLNGKHGIVVAAPNASGGYSYLQLGATVTGGLGEAGAIAAGDVEGFLATVPSATTTITLHRITTTEAPSPTLPVDTDDGSRGWVLLLLAVLVLVVIAALVWGWLRTPEGQRWLRQRRRAKST
jgi:hypothetical protein